MFFVLKNKVINVCKFVLFDNELVYGTKDNELIVNSNVVATNIDSMSIWVNSNFIYFHTNERNKYGYFYKQFPLFYSEYATLFILEESNHIVGYNSIKRKQRGVYYRDFCFLDESTFSKHKIIEEGTTSVYTYLYKDHIIGINKFINELYIKNLIEDSKDFLLKGNEVLPKIEVQKILDIYNGVIFIACSNHTIVCISLQTGEITHTWRELPNINKGSKIEGVIPESKNFVLDKENELLVGRGINTIITIDLKTNNISFVNIDEELKKHNVFALKGISKDAFNSTHLFLTGMMNQKPEDTKFSYDCLFALNRETLQIDWQYNFEEEALGTHKPVLSGNKLYQLDNNKTLHIFEKEELVS